MKYSKYDLYRSNTELNVDAYKALLKDALSADQLRLNAIIDVFISLSVPEDYDGDVDEIYRQGLLDIQDGHCADGMLEYAPLIWALPESVSDAVFHVLEQLIETGAVIEGRDNG